MSDEASAGLEDPLLETREGPTLDSDGQDEPTEQIAEVVGDDAEKQSHLVGPESMTREACPVGSGLALLDPLLGRPALVVEADDRAVRSRERGNDEAYPRKQLSEVMLSLGDHASRSVPGRCLTLKASVLHQRGMARSATGPCEQILDLPLQQVVGWEADRVSHPSPFQGLIEGGQGERRVCANDDGVALRAVSINDGEEHSVPSVCAVDVARPKLGHEAVRLLSGNSPEIGSG